MHQDRTEYGIMHAGRCAAIIRKNGSCDLLFPDLMPYGLYLEEGDDLDTRISNLQNFYHWCASRVLTLDRRYAKEIMASIGAGQYTTDQDRAMISLSYHCLSLTDVCWVDTGDGRSFSEIDLYDHSLSGAFTDVSLKGRSLTAANSELIGPEDYAADTGTAGVAPKAWIRDDKGFSLLKDGSRAEVETELLASRVARCFDVKQVMYEPDTYDGETVTRSRIITSLERGIVPMEHLEIYLINHDIDRDEFIGSHDAYTYHMMNIVDYLVGNTDRHWGNWGFYIDNGSNRITEMYPLMDFNRAFLSYDAIEGAKCQTTSRIMSQKDAAIEAVQRVGLNQISEVAPDWFTDQAQYEMFSARLQLLIDHLSD